MAGLGAGGLFGNGCEEVYCDTGFEQYCLWIISGVLEPQRVAPVKLLYEMSLDWHPIYQCMVHCLSFCQIEISNFLNVSVATNIYIQLA